MIENESIQWIDRSQAADFEVQLVQVNARYQNLLDDIAYNPKVHLEEYQLQMLFKEFFNHEIRSFIGFFVLSHFSQILIQNWVDYHGAQLAKWVIIVKITNRKVDIASCNAFAEHAHQRLEVFVNYILFLVSLGTLCSILWRKAFVQLKEPNRKFWRLLEDNEAIDVPGVESQAIGRVVEKLLQEFQNQQDHIIVINKCSKRLFNYFKVLRIEPVKQQAEILVRESATE